MTGRKRGRPRKKKTTGAKDKAKMIKKSEVEEASWSVLCPICKDFHSSSELSSHLSRDHSKEEVCEALVKLLKETRVKEEERGDTLEIREEEGNEEGFEEEAASPPKEEKPPPPAVQVTSSLASLTCSVCSKTFSSRGNLVKHAVRHSKDKPFKCKECGQVRISEHL